MASDMEVHLKQMYGIEFLHVEKLHLCYITLMLTQSLRRINSGCKHNQVVASVLPLLKLANSCRYIPVLSPSMIPHRARGHLEQTGRETYSYFSVISLSVSFPAWRIKQFLPFSCKQGAERTHSFATVN